MKWFWGAFLVWRAAIRVLYVVWQCSIFPFRLSHGQTSYEKKRQCQSDRQPEACSQVNMWPRWHHLSKEVNMNWWCIKCNSVYLGSYMRFHSYKNFIFQFMQASGKQNLNFINEYQLIWMETVSDSIDHIIIKNSQNNVYKVHDNCFLMHFPLISTHNPLLTWHYFMFAVMLQLKSVITHM